MIPKPKLLHLDAIKYLETSPQKHLIRLAALCESYQMIEFAFPLFRFSKKEAQYLHFLISPPQIISTEHAFYHHGYEKTLGLMLIEKLTFNEEKLANWTIKTFPLKGEDLIQLGYSPDRILGKVLKETEAWWIEHHFTPSKADCLNYVRSHFQQI